MNDRYDLPYSIKDDEQDRRSQKHREVGNVFPKPDDKFPKAVEFNRFLSHSGNKVRLQKLVKITLRQADIADRIIYCEGEEARNLGTGEHVGVGSNHTEADTKLLTAYAKLRSRNYMHPVVMDSEDTNVYAQSPDVSHNVHEELLLKREQQLSDC